ncbi:class II glutamine amidotransferase [Pseudothermotoga sp. U03pept]|uniref:class II glutamine amidotransferase n=1 Tax=Pseudothermotoga sp. U03pept TaxID=3447012 RepID=UPI003F1041EB
MCRMIGFSFKDERPVDEFFVHLQRMAKNGKHAPHNHGWGIYALNGEDVVYHRSEKAAFDDTFPSVKLKVGIIHARKASENLPVTILQIHPFIDGCGKAFCHNGTIKDIPFHFIESDTYSYFSKLRQFSSYEELRERIAHIAKNYSYTSMNFLMINRDELIVYCGYSTNEDYYTLWYSNDEGFVVCSEPMNGDYFPMANQTIFVVRYGEIVKTLTV